MPRLTKNSAIPISRKIDLYHSVSSMLARLTRGPCSLEQLQVVSGLSPSTIRKWLAAMRGIRFVRVVEFEKGRPVPVFGLNPYLLPDAIYRPLSHAQHCRNRRARMRDKRLLDAQITAPIRSSDSTWLPTPQPTDENAA